LGKGGKTLGMPENWRLTGYLCIGKAAQDCGKRSLRRTAWQENITTL